MTIPVLYGTAARWALLNPIVDMGKPGWESDTGVFKIGDGATRWASLPAVSGGGGGGGGSLAGATALTLPTARLEHEETITATGVTPASVIFVTLQAGSDSDENTAEKLDVAAIAGIPGTDQITVRAVFLTVTSGPVLIYWSAM